MILKYQFEIPVTDESGKLIAGANVLAVPESVGETATAEWDEVRQVYGFKSLLPGFYSIELNHPDFRTQRKRVQVHPRSTEEPFVLVRASAASLFRDNISVAYESEPDLLGIIPAPDLEDIADEVLGEPLRAVLDRLGLVLDEATAHLEKEWSGEAPTEPSVPGAMLVRRRRGAVADENLPDSGLRELRASPRVQAAGPVVHRAGPNFTILTNRLLVRFRPEVSTEQADRLLSAENLTRLDQLQMQALVSRVQADPAIGAGISQIAERLVESGLVEYAEPELAESPELDAVRPANHLWPGEWDRQLVGCDNAWQALHDAHGVTRQFGRPDVIIAVVDTGIRSALGVVENPNFQGAVSDGTSKVYQLFDFQRMVPDNDRPALGTSDHGVACAGVAAASAVRSGGAGFGVAGAAPNTRLLGLIFPATEAPRLQMYIWAAGLNAKGTPPFPARIQPGADVLTCSIGFGAGFNLSRAAKDMLDYITSRGRKGKGCIAVFSAGNTNQDIRTVRPYGSYERSFSCAATSLDATGHEIRAPYSGWGRVAWCTPSNGDSFTSLHDPPNHYAVWTTSFLDRGNLPSLAQVTVRLAVSATAGDTRLCGHSP
jgi:hypothetical protein